MSSRIISSRNPLFRKVVGDSLAGVMRVRCAPAPVDPAERALIEAFIAKHGVTRCPTAAVAVTTGDLKPEGQSIDRPGIAWKAARKGRHTRGYNARAQQSTTRINSALNADCEPGASPRHFSSTTDKGKRQHGRRG